VEAVDDLSLTVAAGERVAYIGPNGAGKSTSIKILTGIFHPTAMRRTLLSTKLVEVGLSEPAHLPAIAGVSVLDHSPTAMKTVDTATTSIRHVLDSLLDLLPVSDISVVDPPLEQVIASIYARPRA
jgi:ABC-type uncharacterized transport system ATPase subunit